MKVKQTISLKEGDLEIEVEIFLNDKKELDVTTNVVCSEAVAEKLKEELTKEGWKTRFLRLIK